MRWRWTGAGRHATLAGMTPAQFIAKWRAVELKERSASQSHFLDLCLLLGVPDPISADPTGEAYCFEKGATKANAGKGWALPKVRSSHFQGVDPRDALPARRQLYT
jgi:hypothetical protein